MAATEIRLQSEWLASAAPSRVCILAALLGTLGEALPPCGSAFPLVAIMPCLHSATGACRLAFGVEELYQLAAERAAPVTEQIPEDFQYPQAQAWPHPIVCWLLAMPVACLQTAVSPYSSRTVPLPVVCSLPSPERTATVSLMIHAHDDGRCDVPTKVVIMLP
jgi:hypothetical protein